MVVDSSEFLVIYTTLYELQLPHLARFQQRPNVNDHEAKASLARAVRRGVMTAATGEVCWFLDFWAHGSLCRTTKAP